MEAKITIKEIRCALNVDVALGKMTKETADYVTRLLGLDWKEKEYNKRKDMDCFLEDLHDLFEKYDASFYLQGTYRGEIFVNHPGCNFTFGEPVFFDKDFIALLPKKWKRTQMVRKLKIPPTIHVDELKPIFEAIHKVDCRWSSYITDKKFNEMIKPYR